MDSASATHNVLKKPSRFGRIFKWSLFIFILAVVGYYFICGLTYSEGTRSGVLTKISKRGYVFKTYEGELNIGGLNQGDGTIMPLSIFKFSVKDEKVYLALQDAQGRKVVLYYKEVIKSFFWQGDSNYFVYKASVVK
jgi:hypothetical protein